MDISLLAKFPIKQKEESIPLICCVKNNLQGIPTRCATSYPPPETEARLR